MRFPFLALSVRLGMADGQEGKAMSDRDLIKLYSDRILELAASIPNTARLEAPDATVRKRSPLCGSTVTVDVKVRDGRVAEYGQDVKACALGQAAASVVGANVVGRTRPEIEAARDALLAMLKEEDRPPRRPSTSWSFFGPRATTRTGTPRSCWRWTRRSRPWPTPSAAPAPDAPLLRRP